MTLNRLIKVAIYLFFLCSLAGCAPGNRYIGRTDYTGVDCDTMYKDCVSRCRQYDTSIPTPDKEVNWSGATGDCYLGCETKKRRCILQNQ